MKTAETALTEWTCNEIKFDYQQGKGPQSHSRKEFKRTCARFRHGEPNTGSLSTPPQMFLTIFGTEPIRNAMVNNGSCGAIRGQMVSDLCGAVLSSGGLVSSSVHAGFSGATISQDLMDYKAFAQIQSAINTFVTLACQRIPQTEMPKLLDQHFDPMYFLHFETLQEVITELIRKVKL